MRAEVSEEPGGTAGDAPTQVRLSEPNPESASHLGEQGEGSRQKRWQVQRPRGEQESLCLKRYKTLRKRQCRGDTAVAGPVVLGRRVGVNRR